MSDPKLDLILEIVTSIDAKVDALDKRVATLESDMKIVMSQLDENTDMLKAIHHRQEESDAKIESFTLDMAQLHGALTQPDHTIAEQTEEQKSMKEIIGEHEIAIRSLKRHII